ncbi:patched domain-containing protein 3-like [Diadema antillarum]|uniref:patched domain-containing protein 3-like n=1 Tax=Diadema antillarum TaxID=105358 RepID=UPI003A8C5686
MASYRCIERGLSKIFGKYGRYLARWPAFFLTVPLLLTAVLGSGIVFLQMDTDVIYLFTPDVSRAHDDAEIIYDLFPVDYDEYYPSRGKGDEDLAANIIVQPKTGDNVLTEAIIAEMLRFDRGVRNITVLNDSGVEYNFEAVCARQQGDCLLNSVLQVFAYNESRVRDTTLTYPLYSPTHEDTVYFLGPFFGDVTLGDDMSTITKAGFTALAYYLKTTPELESEGRDWEKKFVDYADNFRSDVISVSYIVSQSLDSEIHLAAEEIFPFFTVSYTLICTFACVTCVMTDWVYSKSLLAFMGVISASLAVASTLGLLSFAGVNFNVVTLSMPFLILGIGLDDMFIMVAAWRKTSPCETVEERMGGTYAEAAISITITSITDALAFCIGSIAPLPAVRVFCLYTGVAVIFDFIFQITFFGACMVYSGRREEANRHCMTLMKVLPHDQASSTAYKLFCAGGMSPDDRRNSEKKSCETGVMTFFKDYYGPALLTLPAKILTLLMFCGYLGGAIYGCVAVTEGFELKLLARDGSAASMFFEHQADYFSEYSPFISVAFQDKVNYSDPAVQRQVENVVADFESSDYIHSAEITEFWLRDYLSFLQHSHGTDASSEDFISILVTEFLQNPIFSKYVEDIVFEEGSNNTVIAASRFLLTGKNARTTNQQIELMADVRQRADGSNMSLTAFSPFFITYEQYVIIRPLTIQTLSIAVACMFVIAFILIPSPICSLVVTICIASIEIGIIGYMSLWDVSLDSVSMINLILCIGYSVDFSAHITYSFLSGTEIYDGKRKDELSISSQHAVMALYSLGMPILQGAISTIIAVIVLNWSSSYIFRAFFKIMFLVMVFGMLHSLVFLPVLLSSFGVCLRWSTPSLEPLAKPDKAEGKDQVLV